MAGTGCKYVGSMIQCPNQNDTTGASFRTINFRANGYLWIIMEVMKICFHDFGFDLSQ